MKQFIAAVLVLVLALSVVGFAQESKKEVKKEDKMMTKEMKLKEFSCNPECGFLVRSHDESEIMSLAKTHAKQYHNMDMTDEQVKEKMHDAKPMMGKDMTKKKTMKEDVKKEEMQNNEMKH